MAEASQEPGPGPGDGGPGDVVSLRPSAGATVRSPEWSEGWWPRLRESARRGLWFVPGLFLVGSILLSRLTLGIDRAVREHGGPPLGFVGDARNAEAFLATLSGALLI